MIAKQRAEKLVEDFKRLQVLVVGDLMLDRYVVGDVERVSPEAPVPVLRVTCERSRPGGAANVALNIQALGGGAVVAGVVGKDASGDELLLLLAAEGISTTGVVVHDDLRTTVKTRIMAERQQIVRVDRESPAETVAGLASDFCSRIEELATEVDGLVIEDYGKGSITQATIDTAVSAASKASVPVGLDPKDSHELAITGITVATPNYKEACAAAGVREHPLSDEPGDDSHLIETARTLRSKWNTELLIVTLGPRGMFLLGDGETPTVIPTRAREVFDVSGAGDTVIAAAILALAAGANYYEAASLANFAAGVVVGKVGTAPCTAEELLGSIT